MRKIDIKFLILSLLILSLVACSGSGGASASGNKPTQDTSYYDESDYNSDLFTYNDVLFTKIGVPDKKNGKDFIDKFQEISLTEETYTKDDYVLSTMETHEDKKLIAEKSFLAKSGGILNLTNSELVSGHILICNGGILNVNGRVKLKVTNPDYTLHRFAVSYHSELKLNDNASLYLDSDANTRYAAFMLSSNSKVTQGKNTFLSIPSLELNDVKRVKIENMEIRGHKFTQPGSEWAATNRPIAIYALKSPVATISNSKINGDIHYGSGGAQLTFNNTEIEGSVFIKSSPPGGASEFNIDEGSVLKTELVKITDTSPNFKLKVGFNNKTMLRKSFIELKGKDAHIPEVVLGRHGGLDLTKMGENGKLNINGNLKGADGSVIKMGAQINKGFPGQYTVFNTPANNREDHYGESANRSSSKLNQIIVGGNAIGKADVEFYKIGESFGTGGAINGKDFIIMKVYGNNNIELKSTKRITAGGYEYDLSKDGKIWHLKSDKKK